MKDSKTKVSLLTARRNFNDGNFKTVLSCVYIVRVVIKIQTGNLLASLLIYFTTAFPFFPTAYHKTLTSTIIGQR